MLKLPLDSSIFSKCGIKVAGALKDCLYVGELTLKKLLNDQFTPLIHVCKHRRWLVIPLWAGLECSCGRVGDVWKPVEREIQVAAQERQVYFLAPNHCVVTDL